MNMVTSGLSSKWGTDIPMAMTLRWAFRPGPRLTSPTSEGGAMSAYPPRRARDTSAPATHPMPGLIPHETRAVVAGVVTGAILMALNVGLLVAVLTAT